MPSRIWTGTISFGLVAIPVALVAARRPQRVRFRMLHEKDHAPLRRAMFDAETSEPVLPEEQVRAYEIEAGKYVPVTDDELEDLAPKRSEALEIEQFVEFGDIDPLYFDNAYYVQPLKGGAKPYNLLVKALAGSKRAGLARFVMRAREHLAVLVAVDKALTVFTLHFHDDVVDPSGLPPADKTIKKDTMDAAVNALNSLKADFDPSDYKDEHRKTVERYLKKKAREDGAVESPVDEEELEDTAPEDLVKALEASLKKSMQENDGNGRQRRRKKA